MTDALLSAPVADYLERLEWSLRSAPEPDRRKIKLEITSHLADRALQGEVAVDAALAAMGPPDVLARRFLADCALEQAVDRPAPGRLLLVTLDRAGRSFAALVVGFIAVVFYVMAIAFALVAILKPVSPDHVGAWIRPSGVNIGATFDAVPLGHELLGYWLIPVAILCAILSYLAGTALLRHGARRLLKRRPLLAA